MTHKSGWLIRNPRLRLKLHEESPTQLNRCATEQSLLAKGQIAMVNSRDIAN